MNYGRYVQVVGNENSIIPDLCPNGMQVTGFQGIFEVEFIITGSTLTVNDIVLRAGLSLDTLNPASTIEVNWGDGSTVYIGDFDAARASHEYTTNGRHVVGLKWGNFKISYGILYDGAITIEEYPRIDFAIISSSNNNVIVEEDLGLSQGVETYQNTYTNVGRSVQVVYYDSYTTAMDGVLIQYDCVGVFHPALEMNLIINISCIL